MNVITDPFFIFGIVVTILAVLAAYSMFKPNKTELTTMRDWVSREKWAGNILEAPLESWSQTESKYGNDFFYNFSFSARVNGAERKYIAKGTVRPDDIHKLKKGLTLVVKYSNDTPPKIAVMAVIY